MMIPSDPIPSGTNGDNGANGTNGHAKQKPHLVWSAIPSDGHTAAQLWLAGEMVQRGYQVTFIGGDQFAKQLARVGVKHAPLPDYLDPKLWGTREKVPVGLPRLIFDIEHIFVPGMSASFNCYKQTLEDIRAAEPQREVIVMQEQYLMGVLPWIFGAAPPRGYDRFPRVININAVPLSVESQDTGPFGTALPPDATPSGRARNKLLNQLMLGPQGPFEPTRNLIKKTIRDLGGAEVPEDFSFITSIATSYEATLQLTTPSLEYPRSDLHPSIKLIGCPPRRTFDSYEYPSWWDDLKAQRASGKNMVAVAQGTVATDYRHLLIPTVEGLAGREDVVVVAVLGVRGASLPDDVEVPTNTRVVDFMLYDALLPETDVWVMNAGYGGFQHGVVNGVPMVLAGDTEDKPEVSARGEWSGVAVNLRTGTPETADIVAAVDEVLGDDRFKQRVLEIKAESEALETAGLVERQIVEFTG